MSKADKANSQAPSLRPNNPFANLSNDNTVNNQGIASSDSQLEELRKRVDDSAYANTAYDRANAFSVTNTREQPNIGIGGSATAYGGIKDADLSFTTVATNEPEPMPEPQPEPVVFEPEPMPAPQPAPKPEPVPELPPEAPKQQYVQPVQSPQPQPTMQSAQPVKEKSGLSLPLIIVIILVVLGLIALAIWGIMAMSNRGAEVDPGPTPEPTPTPTVTTENIDYTEYNRRIDEKEAINCTATYNSANYLNMDYDSSKYDAFSEKSWTVAADQGWTHVYVSNYDFAYNLAGGSALESRGLRNSPASIYFDDQDAYLWSVTLTPRAGGNGVATYRLGDGETVAPSMKLTRADVESSMLSDFYESVKVSESEINDTDSSSLTFTCKNTDISEYQEFIDARKAEIGAGDAQ